MWACFCTHMKIIELDQNRINKSPDEISVIVSNSLVQDKNIIHRIELRLYIEETDAKRGTYYLITSFVDTDLGSVEMIYEEGFLGQDPLGRATRFLISTLGISGLVLRSLISLHGKSNQI